MAIETLQYVYQLSDFDTTGGNVTPPNEMGIDAQGSPPFNIQLSSGAGFQQLVVNDAGNDGFDEINSTNQTLEFPITLDTVTYAAGQRVFVNYVLETAAGFRIYSVSIGQTNSANNTTNAIISETPFVPGQQYVFTIEGNIGNGEVPYPALACFVEGTMIDTVSGPRLIQALAAGDMILTVDNGPEALRWIGSTRVRAEGDFAPVVFADGAIGNRGELAVSPNHRVLFMGARVELTTGFHEALVAAKHLVNGHSVKRRPGGEVTYYHLLFDTHQIVMSNCVPSESFFPGAVKEQLTGHQRSEVLALFPELGTIDQMPLVRPGTRRHEAALLA